MDWQIIAMLEHHKILGLCSNIAQFFVSASPAVRSGAAKIDSTGKVDFSSRVISNLQRFNFICVDSILCPHNIEFM